jgi:hypothetical protein
MKGIRTHDGWWNTGLIDERNERPLLIALVATVVAWFTLFVVSLV